MFTFVAYLFLGSAALMVGFVCVLGWQQRQLERAETALAVEAKAEAKAKKILA